MKSKLILAAFASVMLFTGCDTIRDYSVNSYQGVLPAGDMRGSGSVAAALPKEDSPKPSVPEPPVAAAPAAGGSESNPTTPTQPANTAK
jgi:hypothetical protein